VDGGRELDHTQAGAQMAAGCGYSVYHFGAQFVSKLAELRGLQFAQIGRKGDSIQQWGCRNRHIYSLFDASFNGIAFFCRIFSRLTVNIC
jgi:hypothetical protein